jgi:outer membrane lipoprotein-sorting protein
MPFMLSKKLFISCLLALCINATHAQTGEETLQRMHSRYAGKWYRTFTFVQTTDIYRNDSLQRSSTWYEAASFPHDLRIDREDPKNGNATIYRKDSTYRFQNGKLAGATAGTNPFVFLIGGMYAVPFVAAKQQLQTDGFDLSKGYSTDWKGRKALVIGAATGDTTSKQFWVDAEHFYILRYIEKSRGSVMDVHMSNQVKAGGGWSETWVEFYFDGKLRQTEKYNDIKADRPLDPQLYDPAAFGKWHWMQ